MLIRKPSDIKSSEITDKRHYLNRRDFVTTAMAAGGASAFGAAFPERRALAETFKTVKSPFSTDETPTPKNKVTTYNNYYDLGVGYEVPSELAAYLKPSPWTVSIEGECAKPGKYTIEDILKGETLEDRIFRHRCVEGWSMIIPWVGFPLANLLKRVEPTGNAKYVAFETLMDPKQLPGQRTNVLEWPYLEGLRIDEAMHPLTTLVTGLYGESLPAQNGAPLRLAVPWKYGFKHIKSIVKIRLVSEQPRTAWNIANAREYGFYSNVNPTVDHPRWSQATERRIGEFTRRKTLMFNGYGEQVASLYGGMDLVKNY